MAGSGGGPFKNRTAEELAVRVRQIEDSMSDAAFGSDLARVMDVLLGAYNGRDVGLVRERLDAALDAIQDSTEGSLDQLFGGSVEKHTYVDGLSDIDALVFVNNTDLSNGTPRELLQWMHDVLSGKMTGVVEISHGKMAVTIEYSDGMEIQLLPAIKDRDGEMFVPSSRTDDWSRIAPQEFSGALTRRNEECGHKLVPTIKLVKGVLAALPQSQALSGYHIESLAIDAFRGYEGVTTTVAMVPKFFAAAKELVLSPIRDRSGQSLYVDEYLGPSNSAARMAAAHLMGRIETRMRNSTALSSIEQWKAILGVDE